MMKRDHGPTKLLHTVIMIKGENSVCFLYMYKI